MKNPRLPFKGTKIEYDKIKAAHYCSKCTDIGKDDGSCVKKKCFCSCHSNQGMNKTKECGCTEIGGWILKYCAKHLKPLKELEECLKNPPLIQETSEYCECKRCPHCNKIIK